MSEYRDESDALDADLRHMMRRWRQGGHPLSEGDFNHLALRLFAYQMRYNTAYRAYCESLNLESAPQHWKEIPPVPSSAFKDAQLATFDVANAALRFHTSGTTQARSGTHYMENNYLYDEALLAGFERLFLKGRPTLRYFNIVPNPRENPHSSLGYMMARAAASFGDAQTGWYLENSALLYNAFVADLEAAIDETQPVCIAGTAFGLLFALDECGKRAKTFSLPQGSVIMETGGFKGRTRAVARDELYSRLSHTFGLERDAVIAEYGMTELTSQYYDDTHRGPAILRTRDDKRRKVGPTWLRARVVDERNQDVAEGIVGSLVHYDLGNRSSVLAITTEDLGAMYPDGFVLLGRDEGASLRGCSLDAEDLRV